MPSARTIVVIIVAILVVGAIVALVWIVPVKNAALPTDRDSEHTLSSVQGVMASLLGSQWPWVLVLIAVLLAVILFLLVSSPPWFTVAPGSHLARWLKVMVILFAVLVVAQCIAIWLYGPTDSMGNYVPAQRTSKQIIEIFLVVVVLVSLLMLLASYMKWW